MHEPLVAIVILNYNGKHYLEKFMPSVVASTYINKKIVVADNASTDDSLIWLKQDHPQVEIILLDRNYGFAKGYNEALKHVQADYYILLNSDVEVVEDWIEPAIALMEQDEKIAACQPKLLAYDNRHLFEYAGASGGWLDMFGYPFSRGRIFDFCEEDNGQYEDTQVIFWASGAAMIVRPNVYHEMNGFDEFFFAHQEEIDLCWRMQKAGYKIMSCPKSVVYHVGGGTLPKGNQRKVFLNFRNNLVMLAKNWSWAERLTKLPFRIGLDVISSGKALILGDRQFFLGVIKAHFAFYKWILSSKKSNNFSKSKKTNLSGYYKGSVVWHHFIKKKKTFKEIIYND
jgi:GT2 family glycosyltransferase